jgi:hypothetical protein
MFERFTQIFWGDFNNTDKLKKIFGLAIAAFFLIGAQWPVKILKDTFGPLLPEEIINRDKAPLKNPNIKEDKIAYRYKAIDLFLQGK